MSEVNKITNVFILSSGRSGSTLLSNILNAHSCLLSVPESTFFITLTSLYKNKKQFNENDYKRIVDAIWLRKQEYSGLWKINNEKLLNTLSTNKPQTLKEIFKWIYLSYNGAGKKEASIIVDKNPFYFQFIDRITNTYPDAKHILLVRDYRDRYISLRKSKYVNQIAGNLVKGISWNTRNKALFQIYKEHPNQTLLVKYEELVSHPENEVKRICDFLQINFESSMFDYHLNNQHDYQSIDSSKELITHVEDMHKKSNTKISTDRIGIWKENMDFKTLKTLETFCGDTGELFDYKKSLQISNFTKFYIRLKLSPKILKGRILLFFKKKSFSLPASIQRALVNLVKPK